jgi:endonuclease G
VYVPSIAESPSIDRGQVRVSKYLFKLVYGEQNDKAWAYWQENTDTVKASPPISYAELVERTGISFLPSLNKAPTQPP